MCFAFFRLKSTSFFLSPILGVEIVNSLYMFSKECDEQTSFALLLNFSLKLIIEYSNRSSSVSSSYSVDLIANNGQTDYSIVASAWILHISRLTYEFTSSVTGMTTRNVLKSADDVELKVKMAAKHNAGLQIVQLPNGITVNDLRSFIKEFEVQSGKKM